MTQTMAEREHTNRQLLKLRQVDAFLKELGILDEDDFDFIEF